jgi:hypothetical protein
MSVTGICGRLAITVSCLAIGGYGQVFYHMNPRGNHPWADSMWVGAGCLARDQSQPVYVARVGSTTGIRGELYYLHPDHPDSAVFLFHNDSTEFPSETSVVSLGSFARGTEITFLYEATDTDTMYDFIRGKPHCSGQNRVGIDRYVSDTRNIYGKCTAQGGRLGPDSVVIGFDDYGVLSFRGLVVHISGVFLEVVEKWKVSRPRLSPGADTFSSPFPLNMVVPYAGNTVVIGSTTVDRRPDSTAFKIRYTIDGSDPRVSSTALDYSDPVTVTQTTTVKAYAYLPGDTMWFPSEVMTETYTYQPIVRTVVGQSEGFRLSSTDLATYYDCQGRLMQRTGRSHAPGVYFAKTGTGNKAASRMMVNSAR